jgi:hypothetical protein
MPLILNNGENIPSKLFHAEPFVLRTGELYIGDSSETPVKIGSGGGSNLTTIRIPADYLSEFDNNYFIDIPLPRLKNSQLKIVYVKNYFENWNGGNPIKIMSYDITDLVQQFNIVNTIPTPEGQSDSDLSYYYKYNTALFIDTGTYWNHFVNIYEENPYDNFIDHYFDVSMEIDYKNIWEALKYYQGYDDETLENDILTQLNDKVNYFGASNVYSPGLIQKNENSFGNSTINYAYLTGAHWIVTDNSTTIEYKVPINLLKGTDVNFHAIIEKVGTYTIKLVGEFGTKHIQSTNSQTFTVQEQEVF